MTVIKQQKSLLFGPELLINNYVLFKYDHAIVKLRIRINSM